MKKSSVLGICLLMAFGVRAQSMQSITPLHLEVGYHKTTHLLFPYAIKSVDRGSRDVLAQKAKGVENVLQVKAGKPDFEETNLTVITSEGKLYSFVLHYAAQPSELNRVFTKEVRDTGAMAIFPDSTNIAWLQKEAAWVIEQPHRWARLRDHRFGMQVRLNGLYIDQDVFYYQLELRNKTNINYAVELLRFFIKDRQQSKRTAAQEIIQEPLLVTGNLQTIAANSCQVVVVALPKFTIPDKKELVVQVMERSGGRHLRLKLGNRTIVRAKAIPSSEPLLFSTY